MLEMAKNSMILFFKGKLFKDPASVLRQTALGALLATGLLVVLVKFLALPVWISVMVASGVAGAIQPWLFKDLKYA